MSDNVVSISSRWPCDHPVTSKQRAAARRALAGYLGPIPRDYSPQRLTALAYLLGLAGGVECRPCMLLLTHLRAEEIAGAQADATDDSPPPPPVQLRRGN